MRLKRKAGRGFTGPFAAAPVVLCAFACAAAWRWTSGPRAWKPEETPVAFWSWRAAAPSDEEVARAARATGARVLFLRAGQFDFAGGRIERIRPVAGKFPRGVGLHLVYNATPGLLAQFGRADEAALAAAFAETFRRDAERAARDGASVAGLQLDLDVPTRLLPRYGRVLGETRKRVPAGLKLSVTGLPTWMNSAELGPALAAVDFWTPQFYGSEIPQAPDRVTPISSPASLRRDVDRARALGVPFYAGLAAYGYALLYTNKGRLLTLRGDLDPARVAAHDAFELIERRPFGAGEGAASAEKGGVGAAPRAGEWRYVFRAREDVVVDGLTARPGETLVVHTTGAEGLRAGARIVRERAGERLLGVCVFRLPTEGDRTTLGLAQLAPALGDRAAEVSTSLRASTADVAGGPVAANHLRLTAANDGAAGALHGEGALAVTLRVPRGSVRGVTSLEGFAAVEWLCESAGAPGGGGLAAAGAGGGAQAAHALRPCGPRRADVLRLSARGWPAGAAARVGLSFEGAPPARLDAHVSVRGEDGRVWGRAQTVEVAAERGP